MAEFCWECWADMHKNHDAEWMYQYGWELCEGCGEYKRVICGKHQYFQKDQFLLIDLLCLTVRFIWHCLRNLIGCVIGKMKKR